MLLAWLQSTLSSSILSCVLGSVHSFQVWEKIHDHFQKLTRAGARQLRAELRSTTLNSKNVSEFLLRIKALADALASVGDPITPEQHVDVILEGLSSDNNSVISAIESKFQLMQIEEMEALLAHEMRLEKSQKKLASETASLNLMEIPSSKSQQQQSSSAQANVASENANSNYNSYSGYCSSRRGRDGRNGCGWGRGGRYPNVQCQVCYKLGHPASNCYRYDQNYQPQMPRNFQGFQPSSNPSNWNSIPQNYGAYQPNNFSSVNSWRMVPK